MTKSTPKKQNNRRRQIGVAVAAVVLAAVIGFVAYTQLTIAPTPTVNITLYGGTNAAGNNYGFSNTTYVYGPGPTLTFKVGDVVNFTFVNVDKSYPHSWAMVNARVKNPTVVFGAQIDPIPAGTNASVVFTVTRAGNYFYACIVDIAWGMWGNVVVNP